MSVEIMGSMSAALCVHVTTINADKGLVYEISILSQRRRGREFNVGTGTSRFVASNNFRLVSDSCPEVAHNNEHYRERKALFVRGMVDRRDTDVVTVDSTKYIEELRVAVEEYNERMG